MEPRRRAVITGAGVIAPNGFTLKTFWESLCEPRSAASFVDRFDTSSLPTKVGCLVKDFKPEEYMDPKTAKRLDISYLYGRSEERRVGKGGIMRSAIEDET